MSLVRFFLLALFFAAVACVSHAEPSLKSHIITIQSMELKTKDGRWLMIIEPDRVVDLDQEEPDVTFYNNGGRIPAGSYVNYRLTVRKKRSGDVIEISGEDFEPIQIKKGSFVGVYFALNLDDNDQEKIEAVKITIDETDHQISSEKISVKKQEKKVRDSIVEDSIVPYPLTYREKPIGYSATPPGYTEKPEGFREYPIGYANPPANFREKNVNTLDTPRGYRENPPDFIEKDSHPSANADPSLRISTEDHPVADKDPDKRIDLSAHPLSDNREALRQSSIAKAKESETQ